MFNNKIRNHRNFLIAVVPMLHFRTRSGIVIQRFAGNSTNTLRGTSSVCRRAVGAPSHFRREAAVLQSSFARRRMKTRRITEQNFSWHKCTNHFPKMEFSRPFLSTLFHQLRFRRLFAPKSGDMPTKIPKFRPGIGCDITVSYSSPNRLFTSARTDSSPHRHEKRFSIETSFMK